MKIIITGSLAFDYIMDFPGKFSDHILPEKIHQINLSFLVNKLNKQRGGTAGNIAYNLALLGMRPTILATAGDDFADYRKELVKVGADATAIRIAVAEPTASAFIFTDQADNQITGFYPGAMKEAKKLSLNSVVEQNSPQPSLAKRGSRLPSLERRGQGEVILRKPFVVISPNDPAAMMKYVKECRELSVDYMFDPGMQLPRLSDKDLEMGISGAKIVIGNDYEMALIKKKLQIERFQRHPEFISGSTTSDSSEEMLKQVQHDGEMGQIWITTLGAKGSVIRTGDTIYSIPQAKPKAVLDPTGAGDAWRAGFLAGYLSGHDLETCGRMGSVASVYTVEKYGTQTHKFTKEEFCRRYKENFGKSVILNSFQDLVIGRKRC